MKLPLKTAPYVLLIAGLLVLLLSSCDAVTLTPQSERNYLMATVTEVVRYRDGGDEKSSRYKVFFRYEVDGTEYDGEHTFKRTELKKGDSLRIYYAKDPKRARLGTTEAEDRADLQGRIVISGAMTGAGVLIILWKRRKERQKAA